MSDLIATTEVFNKKLSADDFKEMRRDHDRIVAIIDNKVHFFKIMDRLNRFADKWIPRVYEKPTCKRGCNYCCHDIPVAINLMEAAYIEARTGHKITCQDNREDFSYYHKLQKGACVFLKGGECSIYEHRPMVCRTFHSYDDIKHCINSSDEHYMLKLGAPGEGGFEALNILYNGIMKHFLKQNPQCQVFNDIRSFFGPKENNKSAQGN